MSLKVLISNVYKWLPVQVRAYLSSDDGQKPSDQPSVTIQKPKRNLGGRRPVALDATEAARLRNMGWSYRRIAWKLKVATNTVRSRLMEMQSPPPVVPPPMPVQPTQRQPTPPVVVSAPKPIAPSPPVQVAPVAVQQVSAPPPVPYGLDSVPEGTKAFFLVHGSLNQEIAHNCAQPAIGIETWHHDYASLPAFRDAERIWVVVTPGEDERAFTLSIAGDICIRERCLISTGGVQSVCRYRLVMQRARRYEYEVFDTQQFEAVNKFQPFPLASHTDKIDSLLKSPKTEENRPSGFDGSWGGGDSWRIGGTGYQPPSGRKIDVSSSGSNPNSSNHGNDGSGFCY